MEKIYYVLTQGIFPSEKGINELISYYETCNSTLKDENFTGERFHLIERNYITIHENLDFLKNFGKEICERLSPIFKKINQILIFKIYYSGEIPINYEYERELYSGAPIPPEIVYFYLRKGKEIKEILNEDHNRRC